VTQSEVWHRGGFRATKNLITAIVMRSMVGARGFEPPTSSTPLKRATELRYAPTTFTEYIMDGGCRQIHRRRWVISHWGQECSSPVRDRRRSGHGPNRSAPKLKCTRRRLDDRLFRSQAATCKIRGAIQEAMNPHWPLARRLHVIQQ
jgi:hypothetical protein